MENQGKSETIQQSKDQLPFEKLNGLQDFLWGIIKYLTPKEIINLKLTCSTFNNVITQNPTIQISSLHFQNPQTIWYLR